MLVSAPLYKNEFPKLIAYLQQVFSNDFFIATHSDFDLSKSHIILPTAEHYGDDEFLLTPKNQSPKNLIERMCETATAHSNKTFYILTACPWLTEIFDGTNPGNVMAVFWGDAFLVDRRLCYQGLEPVKQKTFSQQWHWTFLSHNRRMHRNFCAMYLIGKYLPNGLIRFDPSALLEHQSWTTFLSYLKYNGYSYHRSLSRYYSVFDIGFERVKQGQGYIDHRYDPNSKMSSSYRNNFDTSIRNILKNSIVDLIAETVFINRTGIHTEKFLNSVYGYTFPIYLNMAGSVQHLRNQGFDMFDDVINHAYDEIQDPYIRLVTAIDDNLEILIDRDHAMKKWYDCQERFDQNYLLVEQMYQEKDSFVTYNVKKNLLYKRSEHLNED